MKSSTGRHSGMETSQVSFPSLYEEETAGSTMSDEGKVFYSICVREQKSYITFYLVVPEVLVVLKSVKFSVFDQQILPGRRFSAYDN